MSGERSYRVLIIDDNHDLAGSLAELFEMRGHKVSLAFSGRDGLTLIQDQTFDLVLMDIEMPGMSGVEALLEIRKKNFKAPIAMMTGLSIDQLLYEALDNGTLCLMRPSSAVADLIAAMRDKHPRGIVLVSDDAVRLAERLGPLLSEQSCNIFIAQSTTEALDHVIAGVADCVVLDQHHARACGLDLYLSLKWSDAAVPTIIVALETDGSHDTLASVRPMARAILTKPFDLEQVLWRLQRQDTVTCPVT